MNHETPEWLGWSLLAILVATIIFGVAVCSGTFGGQSDLEVFRAYVEGGGQ